MPTINDIENKEDSPEQLSLMAGQPTKFYLFAEEINAIVDAIKSKADLVDGKVPASQLPSLIQNTNTYTSLPTTVEQVMSTTLIPANTFKDLDAVQFKALFIKATEVSDVVIKTYINTSNSLVGANQFYKTGGAEFRTLNSILVDSIIAKITQTKIKGSFQTGSGAYLHALFNSSVYNVTEFDFNPTIDNYLITTVRLSSSSDLIKQESLIFSKIN